MIRAPLPHDPLKRLGVLLALARANAVDEARTKQINIARDMAMKEVGE